MKPHSNMHDSKHCLSHWREFATILLAVLCMQPLSGCAQIQDTPSQTPAPIPVKEVPVSSSPYSEELMAEAASALQAAGILEGPIMFDDSISRAAFIRLIVSALGAALPEPEVGTPNETWYAPYVQAGYTMGLFADSSESLSFTPTDGFCMEDRGYRDMDLPISCQDAAVILSRVLLSKDDRLSAEEQEQLSEEAPENWPDSFPLLLVDTQDETSLSCGEAVVCAWHLSEMDVPLPFAVEEPVPSAEEVLRDSGRIIHAGGAVAGTDGIVYTYTNSAESLVNTYRAGHRVIELDFMQTSDGHLAGTHDWLDSVAPSIIDGQPLSLEAWLQAEIQGGLTPLCLESVADFMREHPDLYVVTDVKDGNIAAATIISQTCPDLMDRFLVQIYDDSQYQPIRRLGFPHIIYTLYNLSPEDKRDVPHLAEFSATHPLLGYTFPDALLDEPYYTERMSEIGVMLFVHTINDTEKMETCYKEGITAVYTDRIR